MLLYTWQNRFVATRHLRRAFWPGVSLPTVTRRLVLLREEGLLGFRQYPWLTERVLYFANLECNRALAAAGLLDPAYVGDYPRQPSELTPALRHDLTVVDLRLILEETGVDGRSWISDHQLRLNATARASPCASPMGSSNFLWATVLDRACWNLRTPPTARPRWTASWRVSGPSTPPTRSSSSLRTPPEPTNLEPRQPNPGFLPMPRPKLRSRTWTRSWPGALRPASWTCWASPSPPEFGVFP